MSIVLDHDDPLLVKAFINNKQVHWLLVDIGSTADIMFYDFFKNLRILQSELLPYKEDLIGFSSHHITPLGKVKFHITFGKARDQNHHHQVHCGNATIILQHHTGQTNLECPESCDFDSSLGHEVPHQ